MTAWLACAVLVAVRRLHDGLLRHGVRRAFLSGGVLRDAYACRLLTGDVDLSIDVDGEGGFGLVAGLVTSMVRYVFLSTSPPRVNVALRVEGGATIKLVLAVGGGEGNGGVLDGASRQRLSLVPEPHGAAGPHVRRCRLTFVDKLGRTFEVPLEMVHHDHFVRMALLASDFLVDANVNNLAMKPGAPHFLKCEDEVGRYKGDTAKMVIACCERGEYYYFKSDAAAMSRMQKRREAGWLHIAPHPQTGWTLANA